jgi:signal transduction histidine kinase
MQLAELYSEVDESRRKLDAKIRELSLLNDAGRKMAAAQDQETLLQVALDSISQELEADHCAILLLSPDKRCLQVGASRGTPDDLFLAANALDGEQLLLQIIQEGKPLLLQDIEADARFTPLVQDFPEVDSCMLVPLCVKQLDVGILTMYGYDTQKTLTQDEFEFISSLASQTAISLANIQLTEQRIQHEQMGKLGRIMQYVLHQFAPPFDVIRQSVGQLQNPEPPAGHSHEISRNILNGLEEVQGIADDLLEFARGQRGTLQVETVTVKDLLENFLATIEPTFTERHLSIQTNLQYTGEIALDVHKITRAFTIIVENASQAMSEEGTLSIACREENHGILFEFIDTGCGMSPDLQSHIFEPFVSGAGTRGAGLGLAIAQKILDEHRARAEVQSVLTQGTTVRIWLPRIQHVHHTNHVAQRAEHT